MLLDSGAIKTSCISQMTGSVYERTGNTVGKVEMLVISIFSSSYDAFSMCFPHSN